MHPALRTKISRRTSYPIVWLAFHPYPQVLRELYYAHRFGLPYLVKNTSTCSWVAHNVSGLPIGSFTGSSFHLFRFHSRLFNFSPPWKLAGPLYQKYMILLSALSPFPHSPVSIFPSRYFALSVMPVFFLDSWYCLLPSFSSTYSYLKTQPLSSPLFLAPLLISSHALLWMFPFLRFFFPVLLHAFPFRYPCPPTLTSMRFFLHI